MAKGNEIKLNDINNMLDTCYEKCLNGIPKLSRNVPALAEDYLKKTSTVQEACEKMLENQVHICATTGFLTSFGGAITLPASIAADIGSVLYVQMRMVACVAYLAGYDLKSDQVKTFVYMCLAGISINDAIKSVTLTVGTKFTKQMIEKIPGKVIIDINKKIGWRFLTKFGEKGTINLVKGVPIVGGVIGGAMNWLETKAIAKRAYRFFVLEEYTTDDGETHRAG